MSNNSLPLEDQELDEDVVLFERTFVSESRRGSRRSEGSGGVDDCSRSRIERTRHREPIVRYRRVDRVFRSSVPDFATRKVNDNSADRITQEIDNLRLSQNAPSVHNSSGHNTQQSFSTASSPNEAIVHSSPNRDTQESATPALTCNTPAGGISADMNSHQYHNLDMTPNPVSSLPTIHIEKEGAQNGKVDSSLIMNSELCLNESVVSHSLTEDSVTEEDPQVLINLDIASHSRPVDSEPGSSTNEKHLEQEPESPSDSLTVLDSEYNTVEKSATNSQVAAISANMTNEKGVADDVICDSVCESMSTKNDFSCDLVSLSSLVNNRTENHLEQNLYPVSLSDCNITDNSASNIAEEGIIVDKVSDTYTGDNITEEVRHPSEDLDVILQSGRNTEENNAESNISHESSGNSTMDNFQQELQSESPRNSPGVCPTTDSTATVTADLAPVDNSCDINSQGSLAPGSPSHCPVVDNVNTKRSDECSGNTPETNSSNTAASIDKNSGEDMLDVAPSNNAGVGSTAGNSSVALSTTGSPSHYPVVISSSNMTLEEGVGNTRQYNNINSENGSTCSLDLGSFTDSNSLRGTSQVSITSSGSVASTTYINPGASARQMLSSIPRSSSSTDTSSQDGFPRGSQYNRPSTSTRNQTQENRPTSKVFSRSRTPRRDSSPLVGNEFRSRNSSIDRTSRRASSPAVCSANCHVNYSRGRRARIDSSPSLRDPYQPMENRRRNTSPAVISTQRGRTSGRRLSPVVRAPYVNETYRRESSSSVGTPYSDVEYIPSATPRREVSPAVGVSHQSANNPRGTTRGRGISRGVAAPYSGLRPARRGLSPCAAAGCPRVDYVREQTIQSDASAASTAGRSRSSRSRNRRGQRNSSPAVVSNMCNNAQMVQPNIGIPVTPVYQPQLQPQVQPIYQTAQVLQPQLQTHQLYQPQLQVQPIYTQQFQPHYQTQQAFQIQYDVSQQALQPQYQIYQPQIEAQPNLQQAVYQQQFQPIQDFQLQNQQVLQPQLQTQPVTNRRNIPMPTVVTEKRPTPAKKDGVSVMRLETAKSWCVENYPFHDEWLGIPPHKTNILARTTLDHLMHTDVRFASMNYGRFQGGLFNYNVKNVLEFSNFNAQFRTDDILTLFREYTNKVLVKWVDDKHALLVFKDAADASRVMNIYNDIGTLRNLVEASKISKFVAVKCGFVTKGGIAESREEQ